MDTILRTIPSSDPARLNLQIEAKFVSAARHANLSLRLGRKLKWDASKEEIIGDREASAMLERPYRKPWDGVLHGLLKRAVLLIHVQPGLPPDRNRTFGYPRAMYNGMKRQDGGGIRTYAEVSAKEKGTGPGSAGQSGDTQGLSDLAEAGSESVEELVEEGQFFEAEIISGIENAPDADVSEVRTKQVPEDDVPSEYQERD